MFCDIQKILKFCRKNVQSILHDIYAKGLTVSKRSEKACSVTTDRYKMVDLVVVRIAEVHADGLQGKAISTRAFLDDDWWTEVE